MSPTHTLGELAGRFDLALHGDPGRRIGGVGTLAGAGPAQLAFLANPRYRSELAATRAGAVVLAEGDREACPVDCLVARDPYAAFARVATLFEPAPARRPGVHPSAVVDPDAMVDPDAEVGPLCHVGARSRIAAGATLGPGCIVGEDCEVGAGTRLVARVTLVARVRLGARVIVHPGAVLGADGFGLAVHEGHWIKVPQLGGVVVGDDSEVGANTCIDRGAIEDTTIGADVRLDNQIQVGHNVAIGDHTAIAGCTAIAGSARIGRWCLVAGGVGIAGHIEICDRVTITAMSLVSHSIRSPGEYSSGTPLMPNRAWRRAAARFRRLDRAGRGTTRKDDEE